MYVIDVSTEHTWHFLLVGPFDSDEEAKRYIEEKLNGLDCHVRRLTKPDW